MIRPVPRKVLIGASAATFVAAAAFIAPWEGLYTRPYRDIVGVLTVCYGETEGVKPTDSYTPAQCREMLSAKLPRYYNEIAQCWGQDVENILTDNMRVAFVSGAYNFGSGGFCKSSMVRALKQGDRKGACHALRLYNRAGGRVVKGLDNRRRAEEKLCLEGL
jgi:lysozyme